MSDTLLTTDEASALVGSIKADIDIQLMLLERFEEMAAIAETTGKAKVERIVRRCIVTEHDKLETLTHRLGAILDRYPAAG